MLCLCIVYTTLILQVSSFTSPTSSNINPFLQRIYRSNKISLHQSSNTNNNEEDEEAKRLREKAASLRDQIRKLEKEVGEERRNNPIFFTPPQTVIEEEVLKGKSLKNKRVLVIGANGRLGSMATRYILRNFPEVKEVVAAVHYVGEATTRGYGRLSYEVGAEDGVGTIGAAWSSEEERNARFEYADYMKDYNLQNLRVVEVELLDPVQCATITEEVDTVVWCATDFNANQPRAIASLNAAFLFRAIASPTKGRVEIEGLTNILGGLKQAKQNERRIARLSGESSSGNIVDSSSLDGPNDPTSFIMVSPSPYIFKNYETPFGEFNGLKRQAESILRQDFPSLSHCILQMGMYEDNFVDESLDILYDSNQEITGDDNDEISPEAVERSRRKINRRDAARAVGDALVSDSLQDKTVEVWTAIR